MKTIRLLLPGLLAATAWGSAVAGEPAMSAAHACCPAPVNATNASPVAAPLTDRSIYQLDATWTDDRGESVALASLRGKPVVLTMFFANCEYACPILVHDMQRIRDTLPDSIRAQAQFVLVSFDDMRDTTAALRAYRERVNLDASWILLRGDAGSVQELAMLLGVKFQRDARGQYAHSNLITVLNGEGEVVHQRNGLQGEVAPAANAVKLAAR